MSSKLDISVKIPSGPSSWEEERKEEDLEDLEPDSSGGELGVVQMVVISYREAFGRYQGNKARGSAVIDMGKNNKGLGLAWSRSECRVKFGKEIGKYKKRRKW